MGEKNQLVPGMFCWDERAARDVGNTLEFYATLFGWTVEEFDMGPEGPYRVLKKGKFSVGGFFEMKGPQFENVPPHWMGYIEVEDIDATSEKVSSSSGKVLMPPTDIPDIGRFAVVQDPQGAVVSLFKSLDPDEPTPEKPKYGTICWHELATTDAKAAADFYKELFGWSSVTQEYGATDYTVFLIGEVPVAGMLQMTEEWQGAPPHWMTYFSVENCDGAAEKATKLGAKVIVPPRDVPGTGRFATLIDPEGAVFSIIQMAEM